MKVIIAGGRNLDLPIVTISSLVVDSGFNLTQVVSGGATGVDRSGELYAEVMGIPTVVFEAEWDRYGKRAGPIRNSKMAVYADALIAVPDGGPGTYDMIDKMKALGKPVFIWEKE
jgi:hypothetical protein